MSFRLALFLAAVVAILPGMSAAAQAGTALTIPEAQLIQADELNRLLTTPDVAKPLVLQVGSRVMYDEAHIKGSEYAGPGSQQTGLTLLHDRVDKLPRATYIVIYCGCCPWGRCPNIGPAYKTLVDMGFTHVRALYLADNFGADWQSKGYAIEKGE
jgi:hypothetical protein